MLRLRVCAMALRFADGDWVWVDSDEPAGSGWAIVEIVTRSLPRAAAVRHHRALHFSDVAAALSRVDGHPRIGRAIQLAMRFGVLTAARQAEVRRATWDEFDFESAVWTVPESHMKRHRPHRVPLSTGALAALEEARELNGRGVPRAAGREARSDDGGRRAAEGGDQRHWPRLPFELQGLGAPRGRGRDPVGVRAGARRGFEDGGGLRARRSPREAPPGDAGVVRLRLSARRLTETAGGLRRGRASAARDHEAVFSRRGRADGLSDVVQCRTEQGQAGVVDRDDRNLRVVLLRAELLVRRDEYGEPGPTRLREQLIVAQRPPLIEHGALDRRIVEGLLQGEAQTRRDPDVEQNLHEAGNQVRDAQSGFFATAAQTPAAPTRSTASAALGSRSKSRRNSSSGTPSASQSKNCWTGRRVPRKQGSPLIRPGSTHTACSSVMGSGLDVAEVFTGGGLWPLFP